MTHLSSTSVDVGRLWPSLPSKAWGSYNSWYFAIRVDINSPTQVHIQIIISQRSYIDYSHEFVGSALARFERSTLPDHKGTRTIVLRFLKMVTPVECVRVIPHYISHINYPKEGDLFQKFTPQGRQKVWGVNIDKPKGPNLQGIELLWDSDK